MHKTKRFVWLAFPPVTEWSEQHRINRKMRVPGLFHNMTEKEKKLAPGQSSQFPAIGTDLRAGGASSAKLEAKLYNVGL